MMVGKAWKAKKKPKEDHAGGVPGEGPKRPNTKAPLPGTIHEIDNCIIIALKQPHRQRSETEQP